MDEAGRLFHEVCRALADPSFYPHPVSEIQRRDTHISAVFLTGRWVYKIKKPVDFGFLDFRTLDARLRFCEQEVRLNQRLSHGVYEGIAVVRRGEGGRLSLEGEGDPVEYAVKMRQLPEDASLKAILERNGASRSDMEKLGERLAAFYEGSERSPEIDRFGRREVIELNMEENFRQIDPFVGDIVPREPWEFIRQVSRTFFEGRASLFDRRVEGGRIRDGHGDLKAEHVYFLDGIQIIDCIEFNERFRYGDVAVDLAYLHADIEHLGHPGLSRVMLAAYVKHAVDPELFSLLDFYATYRAVVKVKLACLTGRSASSPDLSQKLKGSARSHLADAYRYALQFSRPALWVFCGLPASGKSALATGLSEALSIGLFQSDRVRREAALHPHLHPGVAPYGEGAYRPELRNLVYGRLLALAQDQLRSGQSVILDASFSRAKWRADARQLAADLSASLIFVHCLCSQDTLRKRLAQREAVPGYSDARMEHVTEMTKNFEPLTEIPPESLLRIVTEGPVEAALEQILSEGYGLKCLQVKKVLQYSDA